MDSCKTLDVTVVLLDDGLSSTAIMPVEIFHAAGALWNALHDEPTNPAFRVRTVSLHGDIVRTPYGLGFQAEGTIDDVDHTDIVIVPSSGLNIDLKMVEDHKLLPWLRRQHAQGAFVVGTCGGAAYVAESGLLDGKIGTTHWALAERFRKRFPQVTWRPELFITEDSRVLCSGGVCGSMDVSLYLVEKLCGHELALQVAKSLLVPMPRLHQSGYSVLPVSRPHDDPRIRGIEDYLQANFADDVSVQVLADRAGMGARTFVRHFKAATGKLPAVYQQQLRIEAAKAMLETGGKPVQVISEAVGYCDVAFFRALFKRETGMTPAQFRTAFASLAVRGIDSPDAAMLPSLAEAVAANDPGARAA